MRASAPAAGIPAYIPACDDSDERPCHLEWNQCGERSEQPDKELAKRQKRRDRPPTTENKRLAEQTRKILGKHYASKYRVR
jgi:hypothetical protein